MAHRLSRSLAALSIACSASGWIHAAEMGEARVASHIGQQLVADIELTSLEDASTPVQPRLASPDVYRGASIDMPPVLASLNMSVMRRDGRQFLHLTSLKPVESEHLHVFLELTDGGQRSVRLVTLWLTPDPNPAPPVRSAAPAAAALAPAAVAALAAAPAAIAASAAAPAAVAASAAAPAAPAPASPPRPLPPVAKPAPAHAKAARAAPVASAKPAPVTPHAAAPAACPQPVLPAQVSACVALDGKNAALRDQIGQLEGKVRVLQAEVGAARAGVLPRPGEPVQAKQAAPAKPAVPPKQAAQKKAKHKRQAGETPLPWLWIGAGAGLLAAGGGAAFALRRIRAAKAKKAKKAKAGIVVTPNVMGGVKSRLMTDPPPAAMPAEPAME